MIINWYVVEVKARYLECTLPCIVAMAIKLNVMLLRETFLWKENICTYNYCTDKRRSTFDDDEIILYAVKINRHNFILAMKRIYVF